MNKNNVRGLPDLFNQKRLFESTVESGFKLDSVSVISMLQNHPLGFTGYIFWKDKNSVYLGCNHFLAQALGLSDPSEIIGKTDYDLSTTMTENKFFRALDLRVITSRQPQLNIKESQTLPGNKNVVLMTSKIPLLDNKNRLTGIFGYSIVKKHSNAYEHHFVCRAIACGLSERQAYVMFHFVKGMTVKQIANVLTLSPRTVEHHLEAIKYKWRCRLRSELIEKALELYHYF